MEHGSVKRLHEVQAYLVDWLARRVWFGMLWFMRRPWLKRMRLNFAKPLPQKLRDNAWASYRRQERFARRYGLTLTRAILWLVLGIVLFQLIGALVLTMQAKGAFSLPE